MEITEISERIEPVQRSARATGFPVLRALAEDPAITVPILAHMDVAGALYESAWHGISSHLVLGKLPRLAGAALSSTRPHTGE